MIETAAEMKRDCEKYTQCSVTDYSTEWNSYAVRINGVGDA